MPDDDRKIDIRHFPFLEDSLQDCLGRQFLACRYTQRARCLTPFRSTKKTFLQKISP